MSFTNTLQLRYLDLESCVAHSQDLEKLLCSCHFLEMLSLRGLDLNFKMITACASRTLKILDLTNCESLDLESIQYIVSNCPELIIVNVNKTHLSRDSKQFLSHTLIPKFVRLDLSISQICQMPQISRVFNWSGKGCGN